MAFVPHRLILKAIMSLFYKYYLNTYFFKTICIVVDDTCTYLHQALAAGTLHWLQCSQFVNASIGCKIFLEVCEILGDCQV